MTISSGLIINIVCIAASVYIFWRSLDMLKELVNPDKPYRGIIGKIRSLSFASGLLLWFSVGIMIFMTGLTGLFEKVIIALQ